MAGLTIDPNAIATARQAGYSDADIVAHLSDKNPAFKKATDAGYSPTEILSHFTPDTSIGGGVQQGAADFAGSVGQSLDQAGLPGGQTMQNIAQSVAPTNYQPAQVVQNGSVNAGDIPRAVAEQGANIAAPILAARIASKVLGPKAAIIAGLGTAGLEMFGPNVLARAKAEGNATPTLNDKIAGAGTTAAQLIAQKMALDRFMPGANPITSTGGSGVVAALKKGLTTAAVEGGSGLAQSAIGQAGATAGTPGGVKIDPNLLASAAITNGITGGALATPRTLADVNNARAFSGFTPDLQDAAQGFSQRAADAAGGRNVSDPAVGDDVFKKASAAVNTELGDSIKAAGQLPTDASNILASIKSGARPTDQDYATLQTALQGNPQAAPLMYLARQAHVASLLGDMGQQGGGKFVGGIAPNVTSLMGLSAHGTTKAVLATLLAEHFGSHLITHAPAALAAGIGTYGLARIADNLSGSRSPMQRFMTQFEPNGAPRLNPTVPPPPPGPTSGPTGPSVPLNPGVTGGPLAAAVGASPWAPQAPAAPPVNDAAALRSQIADAQGLMQARRANGRQTVQQAMPLIARLAAANRPPVDNSGQALKQQIADATALMAARRAQAQQAAPLLKQLASRSNADQMAQRQQDAQYAAADQANQAFDQRAQRAQIADAQGLMASRRANANLASTEAAASDAGLRSQINDAMALMAARRSNDAYASAGDKAQMRDAMELTAARRANATDEDEAAPVAKVTKANGKVQTAQAEPAPALSEPTNERLDFASAGASRRKTVQLTAPSGGSVSLTVSPQNGGKHLNVSYIENEGERLSTADMLDLKRQLQTKFPNAETIGGLRVSGAKAEAGKADYAQAALSEATPKASTFQPLPDSERIYENMDHGEVAEAKLQGKYAKVSPAKREAIREGIISGRIRDENALRPISDAMGNDEKLTGPVYDLLQELHHTSSKARAKEARDYYAAQLPPKWAAKVKEAISDGYINRTKHRD